MTRILVPYHLDERLTDLDVPAEPDRTVRVELSEGDPWLRMAHLYDVVGDAVEGEMRKGDRPVVMSGDCTASMGTVAGMQRAGVDPAVVWFDAHGDVQTMETTTSGYLGGMPLRILAGYRPELIAARLGLAAIAEERIVLVDARDLDPPEEEYLAGSAIRRVGVDELTAGLLPDGPLYLHVDFDVVDPASLPGLRFPAPGGPAIDAVFNALRRVLATGQVAAFGAACTWHPGHGAGERLRRQFEAAV